jgi:hypothetical protein
MAAQIMAAYPQLRPETVRALIVSSAEWTEAMLQMFPAQGAQRTKQENLALIKHCGWGVPDLDRALWSAGNSLSLVLEDQLNPYVKDGSTIKTREMNFHALPWPLEQLEALQDTQVEMRVTLSYFIEPNPSARGSTSKYHYPSHRLRFAVRRPLESVENFQARINAATVQEEEGRVAAPADPEWLAGRGTSSSWLFASRYLARQRSRSSKSWLHRGVSSKRLVAHPAGAGAIRLAGALQPHRVHSHT